MEMCIRDRVTEQARVSNEFHLWELKQKFLSQSKVRFTYYAPDISAKEESGDSGAGSGSHTARQEGPVSYTHLDVYKRQA